MTNEKLQQANQLQKSIEYHKDRLKKLSAMYSGTDAIEISRYGHTMDAVPYGDKMLKHEILNLALTIEEGKIAELEKEFERL